MALLAVLRQESPVMAAQAEATSQPDVKQLYEQYGAAVYKRCRYLLRNEHEAEDALHDVFIKVVGHVHEFRAEASPLTWLVRIATNHCLNVLRSRKALWRDRYRDFVQMSPASGDGSVATIERRDLIGALVGSIEQETLSAALFYFVDEMNQDEAAAAAQCSVPTLRARLRRFVEVARKKLRHIDVDAVLSPPPMSRL